MNKFEMGIAVVIVSATASVLLVWGLAKICTAVPQWREKHLIAKRNTVNALRAINAELTGALKKARDEIVLLEAVIHADGLLHRRQIQKLTRKNELPLLISEELNNDSVVSFFHRKQV